MIKLADIFQSGMTLQREKEIALFGVSDKESEIEVKINGNFVGKYNLPKGEFTVFLPAQKAAFNVKVEIIAEDGTITLENVDIGDVWIAGGQSNMEFLLKYDKTYNENGCKVVEDEHHRFYDVPEYAYPEEAEWGFKKQYNVWRKLNNDFDSTKYFSAVGKYFTEKLRETHPDVPVAIVGCNWGGTVASAWTDRETLLNTPKLKYLVEEFDRESAKIDRNKLLPGAKKAAERNANATAAGAMDKIQYGNMTKSEERMMRFSMRLYAKIFKPNPYNPLSENRPSGLFDNMVKKILPLSCKGIIWYQGESDEIRADIYDISLEKVIESWRKAFGQDLPFIFVQLAPFYKWLNQGEGGVRYPVLREKQEYVAKNVSGAYMASSSDSGMKYDIHPKNKKPIGERLALLALHNVYGDDVECDAPEIDSVERGEKEITLKFKNTYGGIKLVGEKINSLSVASNGTALPYAFEVLPESIVLRGDFAEEPVTISYLYEPYYECNLYNAANIPAIPFEIKV